MVRQWQSIKTELEAAVAINGSGEQRKLGCGRKPNAVMDTTLLEWIHSQRKSGKSVTNKDMQDQARIIAMEQGLTAFRASNGYIHSFKNRHKLFSPPLVATNAQTQTGTNADEGQGERSDATECSFGMDIGLKNVKCALVCVVTGTILATSNALIQHDDSLQESERSVANVLVAVFNAIQELPTQLRRGIRSIGICGVMHGILWWHCSSVRQAMCDLLSGKGSNATRSVDTSNKTWPWSVYITYLDQRCTPSLLTKWRTKIELENTTDTARGVVDTCTAGSSSFIASGYGLATYAYMLENQPRDLDEFDACGTIQDFLAFALCGLSSPTQTTMDTTNAFSWGGYDIDSGTWNLRSVQALGIPTRMLPVVKAPGAIVGDSSDVAELLGLPVGKSIYLPMGDHPCAVMTSIAQMQSPAHVNLSRTSVLNVGSTAQLAMILTEEDAAQLRHSSDSCSLSFEVRPFFSENWYIGVAPSLSGGNIFAWFVKQCQEWSRQLVLDPTTEHLSEDRMYEQLISLGGAKLDTDLKFSPTLYGEWASPDVRGSIDQLHFSNWSLGDISAAICRGLVDNIFSMIPEDLRADLLLQPYKLAHPSQLSIQSTADSAVGVAFIPAFLQQ
ncbi:Sedoheptulokinase [Phytophthora megakarya]|uniref:Sedoheptulokinase n=1 Tax=Phytophthora megakarya TaxID=4795 RepID=A0A225VEY4_9STRA|nr:Sedoheptulokinase [Phytophthora megakarya]